MSGQRSSESAERISLLAESGSSTPQRPSTSMLGEGGATGVGAIKMEANTIPRTEQCNDPDSIQDHRHGCFDKPRGEVVDGDGPDRDRMEVVFMDFA